MWRRDFFSSDQESRYLDEALALLERDETLRNQANATIRSLASIEPVFADSLRMPQSPNHHAEGPFLEDHLRMTLVSLYAILSGKLHVLEIEEFKRMHGYEGEFQEMEDIIKEHAASFETFVLCHDAAKWSNIFFIASPGTRGFDLGFHQHANLFWDDARFAEQAKARKTYLELFDAFAKEHANESGRRIQEEFYDVYRIRVRNAGHDKAIHSPVYRGLLARVALARHVSDHEIELLETLIAHHMDPLVDFGKELNPSSTSRYIAIANRHNIDADDFIDFLQACAFLDMVCGNIHPNRHGYWHDPTVVINFFRSEHDFAPWKRQEKEELREDERCRARQRMYRETGLDGVALLDLLGMEPGPAFGSLLKRIHEAIEGYGNMPPLPPDAMDAIGRRIIAYRQKTFVPGL